MSKKEIQQQKLATYVRQHTTTTNLGNVGVALLKAAREKQS